METIKPRFDFVGHSVFTSNHLYRWGGRLARLQFRQGTFYNHARPLVPFLSILIAWAMLMHRSTSLLGLFNETVSIRHLLMGLGLALLWNIVCSANAKRHGAHTPFRTEMLSIISASALSGATLWWIQFIWPHGHFGMRWFDLVGMLLSLYAILLLCSWFVSSHLVPLFSPPRVALIVGTGALARTLSQSIRDGHHHLSIGCIDDEYLGNNPAADGYLGTIANLENLLKEKPIETVLIALPIRSMYSTIQRVIGICETVGVESKYMSDLFERNLAQRRQEQRAEHPHFTVLSTQDFDYRHRVKRILDFTFTIIFVCLFAPLMIAIAVAVKVSSPGPIFFLQQRYGMHRQRFGMFKFRTMVTDAEARQASLEALNEAQGPVFKIKKDPRVTTVGAFLRKTSLDELPQFFNVLRGEMSLVGPRPLPLRDVGRFEESWLLRRFSVKPGLTCLWQVTGRSDTSFTDWIKQDLEYIDHWSLTLDMKILMMTVPAVLRGRGAS